MNQLHPSSLNKIGSGISEATHLYYLKQWRIQDFPEEGVPTPRRGGANIWFCQNFPKNCMKLKEFGPRGASLAPPLRSATVKLSFNYRVVLVVLCCCCSCLSVECRTLCDKSCCAIAIFVPVSWLRQQV